MFRRPATIESLPEILRVRGRHTRPRRRRTNRRPRCSRSRRRTPPSRVRWIAVPRARLPRPASASDSAGPGLPCSRKLPGRAAGPHQLVREARIGAVDDAVIDTDDAERTGGRVWPATLRPRDVVALIALAGARADPGWLSANASGASPGADTSASRNETARTAARTALELTIERTLGDSEAAWSLLAGRPSTPLAATGISLVTDVA